MIKALTVYDSTGMPHQAIETIAQAVAIGVYQSGAEPALAPTVNLIEEIVFQKGDGTVSYPNGLYRLEGNEIFVARREVRLAASSFPHSEEDKELIAEVLMSGVAAHEVCHFAQCFRGKTPHDRNDFSTDEEYRNWWSEKEAELWKSNFIHSVVGPDEERDRVAALLELQTPTNPNPYSLEAYQGTLEALGNRGTSLKYVYIL